MDSQSRNSKCHCGSGLKYKKCHMDLDRKTRTPVQQIGILKKMSNKGLTHEQLTRQIFGIGQIKQHVLQDAKQKKDFDDIQVAFLDSLAEAGYCKKRIREIVAEHTVNIESGRAANMQAGSHQLNVTEDVSVELRTAFKGLFLFGDIALSHLEDFGRCLGYEMHFIIGNDKDFEVGVNDFVKKHDLGTIKFLAERIKEEREGWYKTFRKLRVDITHKGWKMPEPKYIPTAQGVKVSFPSLIPGLDLVEGCEFIFKRLFEFTEDVCALLLASKLPQVFSLMYIPESQRDQSLPQKYKVVLTEEIMEKVKTGEIKEVESD